ncbi:MAG TPA: PadR family transcriptional regulator [Chloroflexota bacterium]|jgi:DNA-binding PadR family transcriptional regulator|nr:PadR family transcriptional regulator [Chloroflexota bacterium]
MTQRPQRPSPLALALLALLYEAPMHPYRMQQLIKERGKDQVINVQQRASIYQTIERLQRAGLIAVAETRRDERWPERTVYRLTEEGRAILQRWMREMLSTPAREFPEFPAALSFLALFTPDEALEQLEARIARLESDLARTEAELSGLAPVLLRIFLIEGEYLHAMLRAELAWVRAVADDLRAGRLTWSEEGLRAFASSLPLEDESRQEGMP